MLPAAGGKYDLVWMLMMSLFQSRFLQYTLLHYTTMRLEACGFIITKKPELCLCYSHSLSCFPYCPVWYISLNVIIFQGSHNCLQY